MLRGFTLRLWPLRVVTARVATLGICLAPLFEEVAGSWEALFTARR